MGRGIKETVRLEFIAESIKKQQQQKNFYFISVCFFFFKFFFCFRLDSFTQYFVVKCLSLCPTVRDTCMFW